MPCFTWSERGALPLECNPLRAHSTGPPSRLRTDPGPADRLGLSPGERNADALGLAIGSPLSAALASGLRRNSWDRSFGRGYDGGPGRRVGSFCEAELGHCADRVQGATGRQIRHEQPSTRAGETPPGGTRVGLGLHAGLILNNRPLSGSRGAHKRWVTIPRMPAAF